MNSPAIDLSSGLVDAPAPAPSPAQGQDIDLSSGMVDHPAAPTAPAPPQGLWQNVKSGVSALGSDLLNMVPHSLPQPPTSGAIGRVSAGEEGRVQSDAQQAADDQARKDAGYNAPYRALAPVAEGLGVNVKGMEQSAAQGDTGGVLGHAAATPTAMAIGAGVGKGLSALADTADVTRSARAAMPAETAKLPNIAVRGSEDVFRAAAPVGTSTGFRANVYAAAGDLAEVGREVEDKLSDAKGGVIQPDMRLRVTVDALNEHLADMYERERAAQIMNHPGAPVQIQLGEDAGNGLRYMQSTAGEAPVRAIAGRAQSGVLSLQDADSLARAVNSELHRYERMTESGQAGARATMKTLNGLKELDQNLKGVIDKQLQIDGQPGIQSYERRYAAISQIRDQLERRMNATELNQPGVVRAGGQAVRAIAGGPKAIASASQAAVADVNAGSLLERGLGRLAKSGIQAERALPRAAAPLELTPPPGNLPPDAQRPMSFMDNPNTNQSGPVAPGGQGTAPLPPAARHAIGAETAASSEPPVGESDEVRAQNQKLQQSGAQARAAADQAKISSRLESRGATKQAIELNGSGESDASLEAINRANSEKTNGIGRFRRDTRSGAEVPVHGVDIKAGPYDEIIRREANGHETVEDSGPKARMAPKKAAVDVLSGKKPSAFESEAYRHAPRTLSRNSGGGANYSAADLEAFKRKNNIR